ncbi:MAG: T9SS type A sorting domain-containing protein [Ignavibacteriaceae bacterium]|nr:T9SS type A sorting domain-containing protein [Ignavibacteriaceae bacterium]
MKNICSIIFVFTLMLTNLFTVSIGQAQQNLTDEVKQKLEELSRYGVEYKFLDDNTIELTNTLTGLKQIKTLKEPETEAIYIWANRKGIPVLEIDPTQVDTSQWNGWYDYWSWVRTGNAVKIPTQVKDFDGNSFPETYGPFGIVGNSENRIFEVFPDGSFIQRYNYFSPAPIISTNIVDVDSNGLWEIVFQRSTFSYFFEQDSSASLPITSKFVFNKYDGLSAYLTKEVFANMDNDSLIDYVHRGADSTISSVYLFYISEYNPTIHNFEKKWYLELRYDFYDGFDVGDYDDDGKMESILSSIGGRLKIIENIGNDDYGIIFQDSLPLVNMYYQSSGDLDGDGKREFFIGATMGDGNWTTMFETDGDNHYTPRFIFHLLSGGSLDDPTYITDDIDEDGKLEFAILSGGYLYVFKSNGDDSYYLWYLKQGPASFSINFYDMDGDSTKDILWTVIKDDQWTSNIYKGSPVVSVEDNDTVLPNQMELLQNFPNPFNPVTTIKYDIQKEGEVKIVVYDILGRTVKELVNEKKQPGRYEVQFDANNLASGVYLYRLSANEFIQTKKMILMK